jgi:hypothetical protein
MRASLLFVAVVPWLVSGCAESALGVDARAAGDAVSTPGCDPSAIVDDDAERCATCVFTDGLGDTDDTPTTVCGAPVEAPCETRQNSSGEACQLCVDVSGVILYDDCFTAGRVDPVTAGCEVSFDASTNAQCTTCFDDAGNAVSVQCGPRADLCEERIENGRRCRVCTTAGVTVSSTCDASDIDPVRCVGYGNELGSCVDCFDGGDALLSHECSGGGATPTSCEQTVQPEGLVCTVCTDAYGTVVSRSCDPALPQPERCADLVFSEQSCLVCVDADDVVVRVECRDNDCDALATACRADVDCPEGLACFDGACVAAQGSSGGDAPTPPPSAECAPPPACENDVDADGNVCRTCRRSDGVAETRCMPKSLLTCETLPEDQLPEGDRLDDGSTSDPSAPSLGRTCTLCRDAPSGVEVYRDCEGNGAVPPPFCVDDVDVAGQPCSVCYDAVSGAPVYRSCPIDTCAAMASAPLVDDAGAAFVYEGPIARIDSATCEQCRQGDALVTDDIVGAFQPRCVVDSPCTNEPANTSSATGGSVGCPVVTRLVLSPSSCAPPWDAWGDGATVQGELRDVLEFLLDGGVFAVSAEQVVAGAPGCDGCACARGDQIAVEVWAYDEARARSLLGDIVVP